MTKRLFDYDPNTGIRIDFEPTEDGGFKLGYTQDCEDILQLNHDKRGMGREYYANDKEMWRVASIPIMVQFKWLTEHGVDALDPDHWPAVKKLLNDPEYKYLKTAEVII